jgi:lipopolysaccharide transport system permease protein
MVRDLRVSRELAWRLFLRDTAARYRQSLLGYLWAFLPPLATTTAFVLLGRSGVINIANTPIPYPAFVFTGTILWQLFADSVLSPLKTVSAARTMLVKINFPREAIILSGVIEVLFNFAIRLLLLVPVFIFFRITPPATAPLALIGIGALLCLGFTIGILLTPIGILYTDITQALPLVLAFWMLVTPVVYPRPDHGLLAALVRLNPVSGFLTTTRDWLTLGTIGALMPLTILLSVCVLALGVGWLAYRLTMPLLIERMGG